jgi:hypothetical protein
LLPVLGASLLILLIAGRFLPPLRTA